MPFSRPFYSLQTQKTGRNEVRWQPYGSESRFYQAGKTNMLQTANSYSLPLKPPFTADIRVDIVATLSYFDMFSYPLTEKEVFLFLGHEHDYDVFRKSLQQLVNQQIVFRSDDFYCLRESADMAARRRAGNEKAGELMKTAKKVAAMLSWIPFVRGIAVSGSLSKNFADERSDIDLFIITAPGRLWIARTCMHVFKKASFLANKQHLFCMNYYVDESEAQIAEKNIYTAIEVATLRPMQGARAFSRFFSANTWTKKYLPQHHLRLSSANAVPMPFIKRAGEFLLHVLGGNALDRWLMNITARRWNKKTRLQKTNDHGMVMGMQATRHCAKPQPGNFQHQLLATYEKTMRSYLSLLGKNE